MDTIEILHNVAKRTNSITAFLGFIKAQKLNIRIEDGEVVQPERVSEETDNLNYDKDVQKNDWFNNVD